MVVLPVIVNFALTYIYSEIYGDIMMETAANILQMAIDILSSLTYILTIGLLINSLLRSKIYTALHSAVIIFYIISTFLIYGFGLLVTWITSFGNLELVKENLLFIILPIIIDIVVLILIILICKSTVKQYKISKPIQLSADKKLFSLKHPLLRSIFFSVLIIFGVGFINNMLETILLFADYGFPSNMTEFLFISEPYINLIIYAVVGYFTILVLSVLLNKSELKE